MVGCHESHSWQSPGGGCTEDSSTVTIDLTEAGEGVTNVSFSQTGAWEGG